MGAPEEEARSGPDQEAPQAGDAPVGAPSSDVASSRRCPVCREPGLEPFCRVEGRLYHRCARCEARLLDPRHHPTPEDELAHYRLHENDPEDAGYRRFLARLAEPLLAKLRVPARGLDFGCGPGPALAHMLREAGHSVALYDPFFAPDRRVLRPGAYDFVTCSETAEHFHRPAESFDRMGRLLRPGGWLAVMTCFQTDDARFADWHYRRDPTHTVFYRETTLRRLAAARGWHCEIPARDVALLRKGLSSAMGRASPAG